MPHNARLCYISLKLIFKRIIKNKVPSSLKSYHLLTLFLWFMESYPPPSWEDNSVEAFVKNLEALMLFVSLRLRKGDISHYFIRSVNLALAGVGRVDEETLEWYPLSSVADEIEEIVKSKHFPGKYISDQAVVHLMAFNPEEHLKIVRSRYPDDFWIPEEEANGKYNAAISSDQEDTVV